jgi:NAD+ diphosphatase
VAGGKGSFSFLAGAFYTKDNLPEIPKKLSLARKLIDAWLEEKDHL